MLFFFLSSPSWPLQRTSTACLSITRELSHFLQLQQNHLSVARALCQNFLAGQKHLPIQTLLCHFIVLNENLCHCSARMSACFHWFLVTNLPFIAKRQHIGSIGWQWHFDTTFLSPPQPQLVHTCRFMSISYVFFCHINVFNQVLIHVLPCHILGHCHVFFMHTFSHPNAHRCCHPFLSLVCISLCP